MIRAVIFDMDGVISDTQSMHAIVESDIVHDLGVDISPDDITRRFAGVTDEYFLATLFPHEPLPSRRLPEFQRRKWEMMGHAARPGIVPVTGVHDLVAALHGNGFLLAVGSASPLFFIKQVLEALQLRRFFSSIASSDEVKNGKPAPDVFLLAAERLEIPASEAVVIEDSRNGMTAAKAAGMGCIGLVPDRHVRYPADVLVTSLAEVTVKMLHIWADGSPPI